MKNLVEQPHILMSVENAYHDAPAPLSHDEAMQVLSGGGKYGNVYPAKGKYGSKENTIFISNPSEAQRALAHKVAEGAGQDSLIESDGFSHKMIFVNGPNKGSVTHGKGTTWHEQEPEDYYTTLPTGEHFTHNFDSSEQDVTKSEELEKSKNVREQRAKVFGTDPNAPRVSNKRMKMMQAIQGYAQKKYGLPLVTASGKRDASGQLKEEKGIEQQPYDVFSPKGVAEEKARQEKVKQLGLKRVDPKPDWRSGQLETQPSPDAAVHELAHLDLAPEQMTAPEFQKEMDRRWGESQKKYGHMQQKKTQWEIQPMSLENPIRRELGLPANRATKPVSEGQAAIDDPTQQRFIQGKDSQGRTVFYDRQSRLMNPETKERLAQIREGSLKFDPKSGWQPSSDVNALINLRGRGMAEEARARSKQRFSQSSQPQQASGEEVTLNDLLSHQGSVEELKEKIKQFSQQPKKLAASEEMSKAEQLRKRCWAGYKAIPGKKPYSKGSCAPVGKNEDLEKAKSDKPFHGYSKEKHSRTGGLSDSYRKKYNRETGSNLKRPVTGKVKAGSKAAKRRKSFCARMSGVKGPTSKEGKLTPKGAALKRWKCSKSEELEKAKLEHYSSKQGLRSIDPRFKGTGVDVRTKGRDTEHPHSFFYRAGTTPEEIVSGQAKSKYTVNIPDEMPLYDLATDNEGHIASAVEQNQGALNMDMVHQRLKDAGYQGFYNSAHPQLSNVVALYHEQPVLEEEGLGKSWYDSPYSAKKRKAELQIDKQKHPEKYNINNEEINRKIAEEFLSSKKDHENPLKNKKQPVQKQEGTDCDDHLDPLKKPYASEAQRRWAHTEAGTKALGGKKAVAHWDEQSRGKDLPEKVKKKDYSLEKVSRADVANSHILMFPVSINGQHRDEHEDLPDYHVTLKWMGDTPHKTVDEIENIVNKHGLSAPKSFSVRPHVFNTPNGPAHVLLLGGNLETLHNAKKEIDEGKPDRYPEYLPHITVSKKIHDAIKNGTMSAEDLNIRVHPLEYRIGDQIVKRFDSTR
jgi:hypothetical protein